MKNKKINNTISEEEINKQITRIEEAHLMKSL